MTFFELGHARSLQAVADQLGEGLPTVKNWSSKFGWSNRLQAFNSGLLQQQACQQAVLQRRHATAWADRLERLREQEWETAEKLLLATQCFLDTLGEEELRRMTLAQVSRALKISSAIGRLAVGGGELPETADPLLSPAQQHLLAGLRQVYSRPASSASAENPQAPDGLADSSLNH